MGSVLFRLSLFVFISGVFGYVFNQNNLNMWLGLAFGAAVQFIINYIIVQFINAYVQLQNKKIENERIKEFSYQGIEVECPCHKRQKQLVPYRFNTDNRYKCIECNKTVTVLTDAYTALATEPIQDTDTTNINILTNAATNKS